MKIKIFLLIHVLSLTCITFTEDNEKNLEIKIEDKQVNEEKTDVLSVEENKEKDIENKEIEKREHEVTENLRKKVSQLFYQTGILVVNSEEMKEMKNVGFVWCEKNIPENHRDEYKKNFEKYVLDSVVFKEMENLMALEREKFNSSYK